MAAKKNCVHCGKLIPETAHTCVFCSTKQPVPELRLTTMLNQINAEALGVDPKSLGLDPASFPSSMKAPIGGASASAATAEPASATGAQRATASHPSQTDDTMMGLDHAARIAVATADAPAGSVDGAASGSPADATESRAADAAAPVSDADNIDTGPIDERRPARAATVERAVMAIAGAVLIGVFGFASSLLVTLAGAQLVLAMYYLVGGILLVAGAFLPLPAKVRAIFAAVVGAVPLFVAAPLVGGREMVGWRGFAAALVFMVLPGALLVRARVVRSPLAAALVVAAVALAALIYLVPSDGMVPITVILNELRSGSLTGALAGLFFLAPLGLVLATLTSLGRESSGLGNLWATLVLLTVSGAVVIAGITRDETSLIHLGVGLLAAGSAAAVGVAQLLELDSPAA